MSPAPDRFDRRLIAPMVLGAILNPVNSSIIAVSLVPIGRAFGTPVSQTVWLVTALYVATAIGQPVTGRLVDAYGTRRLFLTATALTGLAGVIGALAPSFGVLVVARVVLGFGTCAGYPAAMTLIRSEADRTGQASPSGVLTVLAVSSQTIAVVGPTFGGLLIGLGGWRTTLAVNVPLALAAGWTGWRRLPRTEAPGTPVRDLDLPGVGLFAAALVSLALVLLDPVPGHLPLLVVTVAAGAVLVRRELGVEAPFLDLRVLGGNVALVLTYVRMLLSMTLAYAMLYGFTQWLEDGRGLHPSTAGLLLLPLSLTALVVSALTGRRPEIRGKLAGGALLQVVAAALLLLLDADSAVWLVAVLAMTAGASQGLTSLANQNAVYHQANRALLGASSGLLRTFGYLGAMVASAATGAFFGRAADTPGLHTLAVFLLVVAGLCLLVTLTDRSLKERGPMATLDPRTTALLVMDVQPGIVRRLPDPDSYLDVVERAVSTARQAGAHVGYIRVAFADADLADVPAHSSFARVLADDGARAAMHADAPTTAVHERVAPQLGDLVVRKTRVGPFSTTDLADQLAARGATTLVLAGVSTSGVVLSTVRHAADHDYRLIVLADAVADTDPEVHRVLVEKVIPRQAEVVTTDDLAGLLGVAHS